MLFYVQATTLTQRIVNGEIFPGSAVLTRRMGHLRSGCCKLKCNCLLVFIIMPIIRFECSCSFARLRLQFGSIPRPTASKISEIFDFHPIITLPLAPQPQAQVQTPDRPLPLPSDTPPSDPPSSNTQPHTDTLPNHTAYTASSSSRM